ncbi:hypothetical protein I4I73_07835 [Pseudonocardia sp. KRD-184]|uniref:Uncharacterized protein n=1 Tax=Pseudonocardia oceani TaxID=2792013 RepID=A0ABS6UAG1_9PSEU|nr:hypothetical protein [Pseudonocardia oceani]MBW0090356.1 hypothetical protein [Pseudonocardia oceani]MBW0095905.1 hypothetical protein [Pseudonocardia oceani]MBW0108456.1 hypothetical protein [Pseudonocardia oceani]MBW0122642.1 hypothetical protein [Pseudonocardia oceani]MBW0128864.1 hypothetical protein [Pseudonocardia oceani]
MFDKGRSWHLSAAVYRALEAPSGYVRVRSFEPLQQEQMVLSHVAAHGRISRGRAAGLCSLAPTQAGRLLGRLVGSGELVRRGERRGNCYEAPGERSPGSRPGTTAAPGLASPSCMW